MKLAQKNKSTKRYKILKRNETAMQDKDKRFSLWRQNLNSVFVAIFALVMLILTCAVLIIAIDSINFIAGKNVFVKLSFKTPNDVVAREFTMIGRIEKFDTKFGAKIQRLDNSGFIYVPAIKSNFIKADDNFGLELRSKFPESKLDYYNSWTIIVPEGLTGKQINDALQDLQSPNFEGFPAPRK